jgi:hypothetical protein
MNDHTADPDHLPMSDEVKLNLTKLGVIAAVCASVVGLLGAFFILPYRMESAELKIAALEIRIEQQSALLIRIDENVKQLKENARRAP